MQRGEDMVKLRSARYCNLKLFLIYLVVYGHWIEAGIWNEPILMEQYRWIYFVHMPLFAYLTGLFIRSETDCLRQLKRLLPMYLLVQTGAVLLSGGTVKWHTPFWHLWYLLSCCFWAGAAWIWFRFCRGRGGWIILMLGILAGCISGEISWLDRTLSGSRTVVFFPCFWLGVLCSPEIKWSRYRLAGAAALVLAALLIEGCGKRIPVTFLYQATPFGSVENGALQRMMCYLLALLLGTFLMTAMPDIRFPWTKAGADTMGIYLLHGPLVAVLREINRNWILCPIYAAGLIYLLYKILRWNSHIYGVTAAEGGEKPWPRSKKHMSSTPGRSTDSFCP